MFSPNKKPRLFITFGAIFVLLSLFLGISFGSTGFSPFGGVFNENKSWLFSIRAPRVVLAFLLGSLLSISGAALQGLLRNPLVSPYTIGVSSGSSLGAVIAIRFGLVSIMGTTLGIFPISIAAGLGSIALLFFLGRRGKNWSGITLLLAGITISFFCSAMIMFIQYTSTYQESFKMVRWLMGTMDFITWNDVILLLPFALPSMAYLLLTGNKLNLFALGEETARSSGVDPDKLTLGIFIAVATGVAASVSIAGPIAFVGLIVPHIIRLSGVYNYRILLLSSLLYGGGFLVLSDLISRIILAPAQVPVGVVTSLMGGPFFLFLLFKINNNSYKE
jgi:cobalamin transport system permease protein